jgi:MFS transporter, putative metabolite:H+ symporter
MVHHDPRLARPSAAGQSPPPDAARHAAAGIAARVDRIPTGRFHGRLASILGVGIFFDGFDGVNIAVVLPLVISAFGLGFDDAGLIISVGYVGQWVGALVVGWLSDRIGRRPAFVVTLLVFGALSLACAFAWSAPSLLAFRVLQGFGLGAAVPIAGSSVSEFLGRRARGRIAIVYQSLFPWGLFFAPLIALITIAEFGPQLGWRVLLGVGALPILVAVWAWFALPESPRWLASKGRIAEADAVVSRMESEARARGKQLPEPSPVPPPSDARLRIGELFSPQYRRRTVMLAVVWFTTYFVIYGITTWLPTMYVSVGGLPQSRSLELTLLVSGCQLVMGYLTAWLVERLGRRTLLLAGFVIAVAGAIYGAVGFGALGAHGWQTLFSAGIILAAGSSIPSLMLYLYTSELYPVRMRGWATSACSSLNRAASIVSPFIFGFMLAGHGGAGAIFTALAVAAAIGLVVLAVAGVETRGRSLEELSR